MFSHCIVLNLFHAVDIVHVHIPFNFEHFWPCLFSAECDEKVPYLLIVVAILNSSFA